MKYIQLRYFKNENSEIPSIAKLNEAIMGFTNIVKLGIQSYPGIKFYINNSDNAIYLNSTGIYELDLIGTSSIITSLRFEEDENKLNGIINYIIVDLICEEAEV